ncbi:MAG: helix-turn-helix transcriptional regulator [Oscillospiraceae bacterium]|nr:helix-turn-helix transcriptional regulator [Oscillospiraceae bacterium]
MNMADRIQYLRKTRGISQETLADQVGVSRQAVSRWESEQSTPDLEKIVLMSDFFGVTTDYILKGIEPAEDKEQKNKEIAGKTLYIASTAFVAIGLFCAFGGWYEEQTMEAIWGSMMIQAIGIAGYFIGKLFSNEKAPFLVDWLNIVGMAFMPVSMLTGWISGFVFRRGGWIAPYPIGLYHTIVFLLFFSAVCVISFVLVRKQTQ